jgi:peptide/nickel transport system substrate-binding protein
VQIRNDRLDRLRAEQSDIGSHVIDEYVAGHINRRGFLRAGALVGISAPVLSAVLAACGSSSSPGTKPSSGGGAAGATIKCGIVTPAGAINPVTLADQGGLDMLAQTGEYLCLSDQTLTLKPVLATSWSPNSTFDVWTFKIRQGVKFHNGAPLTADDVVYTYKLQTNPKGKSSALSAFGGVLTPAGVQKVDDFTVAFHLTAPNGNFPYLTSSDNYNMVILPNNYDPAKWEGAFVGTGPFKLKSYTQKVGASFVRNEEYWGTKAIPAATQFTFYDTETPMILALTSGSLDVVGQFTVTNGPQLLSGGYNVTKLKSSAHRELSMRCDQAPWSDPRVRQALALSLERPAIVTALFKGAADVGNDSPFAPVYPSTNTSIPQRSLNVAKAKALLSAAGHPSGFSATLTGEIFQEIPQYAQIIQQAAKAVGINLKLNIEAQPKYYGNYLFGTSDWLDATVSLVDYGHRGVPNVFLTAPLQTTNSTTGTGAWNAAHFKNADYDRLANQYIATGDLSTQRSIAGQIETLLLDQTPVIYGYFYNYLSASAKNVTGAYPTAVGHIFLNNCSKA